MNSYPHANWFFFPIGTAAKKSQPERLTHTSINRNAKKKTMGFNGRLVMQVLLTISLVLVSVFQGAMLDAFLIDANPSSPSYYFWLLPDFVVAILFFCTMWRSYGYWKKSRGLTEGSEFLT